MRIFIDGDGSPVKDTAIETAGVYSVEVVIVTSIDHYSLKEYPQHVSFVYVDRGADAADYKILELSTSGDIVITQDYGLAALLLPKGVQVLHQLGYSYTEVNISGLLEQRYYSAQARKGGKHTKGPKPYTKEDRENFRRELTKFLEAESQV